MRPVLGSAALLRCRASYEAAGAGALLSVLRSALLVVHEVGLGLVLEGADGVVVLEGEVDAIEAI